MNSRPPPPPSGAPPPYFVGRMYKRSLRPVLMGCCIVASIWVFLWGASSLQDLPDNNFRNYDIAIGILYIVVGLIEVFGVIAAVKQSIALVRAYCYLSIFGVLVVIAAEGLRLGVYGKNKQQLISTCATNATGSAYVSWSNYWGSSRVPSYLDADQAREWCNNRWTRSVWTSVAWLVIACLLGWFFMSVGFSYYHQLLAPQTMPPSQQFRLGQMGGQNAGYYNNGAPYNPQGGYQYPAPRQPPEDYVPEYDPHKVPAYYEGENGRAAGAEKDGPHSSPVGYGYTGGDLGDRSRNV